MGNVLQADNFSNEFVPKPKMSRRYFLTLSGILSLATVTSTWVSFAVNRCLEVRKYKFSKEKYGLKNPLKIVVLGDTHISSEKYHLDGNREATRVAIQACSDQNPDIVLFVGDACENPILFDPEPFSGIKKIGCPIVAILGNHDTITLKEDNSVLIAPLVRKAFEDLGILLLRNKSITLNTNNNYINIVGIGSSIVMDKDGKYLKNGDTVPINNIIGKNRDKFLASGLNLFLAHEPSMIKMLKDTDIKFPLSVHGHTHGASQFILWLKERILKANFELGKIYNDGMKPYVVKDEYGKRVTQVLTTGGVGSSSQFLSLKGREGDATIEVINFV